MVFNWSLSNNKSSQVFKTFLSVLADLNNAMVWMFWILQVSFLTPWGFRSKSTNYNWYHHHLHVSHFFHLSSKIQIIIIIIIIWLFGLWLMVFHWSLSESKSSQVSRTLLSILADLNYAVVWIISTRPLISKCSSPCSSPLEIVLSASNTISITVTFMFHSFFFSSLARSSYLSLLWFPGTAKSTYNN